MYKFNVEKAVQAIAAIFQEERASDLEYLRIIKLLYYADRESICEIGRPIIRDRIVAMDHGPVLSNIYDLVRGTAAPEDQAVWDICLVRSGRYVIRLTKYPGFGKLSQYEFDKIQEVTRRYIGKDQWEIVEEMHKLPEWKSHYLAGTSMHIPVRAIFEGVGRLDKFAGAQRAATEEAAFDAFFSGGNQ